MKFLVLSFIFLFLISVREVKIGKPETGKETKWKRDKGMGVWNIREVKQQKVQITVHKEAREILKKYEVYNIGQRLKKT